MKLETLQLNDLKPAEYNPREISKEEFEGLKVSLTTFGQQENLIVNKDMTIISGHQRYEAMKALGWTEAVCNMVDLDKHAEKKLNVIMNSTAISGKYDDLKLAEILEELKLDEDYESLRLDVLEPLDLSDIEVEEDEAPEVSSEPPISKLGEVYQLGRHRVMCGDSTDKVSVESLMNGVRADMVFTDPPYGMDFTGSVNGDGTPSANSKLQQIGNETGSELDKIEFINKWLPNVLGLTDGGWYICYSRHNLRNLLIAFEEVKTPVRNIIIWNKNRQNMSNSDYKSKYELILYGWSERKFYGAKGDNDVWEIDKENKNELHPTQKPISLFAKAITNSSKKGEIVADIFLGSGGTLIACEQTDRTCYGMELDEKYVDVCRRRYWKFVNDGDDTGWAENTPAL